MRRAGTHIQKVQKGAAGWEQAVTLQGGKATNTPGARTAISGKREKCNDDNSHREKLATGQLKQTGHSALDTRTVELSQLPPGLPTASNNLHFQLRGKHQVTEQIETQRLQALTGFLLEDKAITSPGS